MKKFLFKIVLLFLALFAIDRVAGFTMKTWLGNVSTGRLGKGNYISEASRDEILIFGSSRTEFHYNARMLEDSLGLSAFNCGSSGNGIFLSFARYLMVAERQAPRLVILEITPEYDIIVNQDNRKDLGVLKKYYDKNGIKEIFDDIDPLEKYKMMSYLYRYNSDWAHNPLRLLKKRPLNKNAHGVYGFSGVNKEFDPMLVQKKGEHEIFEVDTLKINYLKRFATTTSKAGKVIFIASPYWYGRDQRVFEPAKHIADSLNIPFIDYSNSKKYLHQDKYFKDGAHLNARGADEFTHDIILEIRKRHILETH